jgi:SAM-dependent methyltransferase
MKSNGNPKLATEVWNDNQEGLEPKYRVSIFKEEDSWVFSYTTSEQISGLVFDEAYTPFGESDIFAAPNLSDQVPYIVEAIDGMDDDSRDQFKDWWFQKIPGEVPNIRELKKQNPYGNIVDVCIDQCVANQVDIMNALTSGGGAPELYQSIKSKSYSSDQQQIIDKLARDENLIHPPLEVLSSEDGDYFSYWGEKVFLPEDVGGVPPYRLVDVLSANTVYIEDSEGRALGVLKCFPDSGVSTHNSILYTDLETYTSDWYYGEPVALEELQDYINGDGFDEFAYPFNWKGARDASLPLYAKVRAYNFIQKGQESKDDVDGLSYFYLEGGEVLFQLFESEEIETLMPFLKSQGMFSLLKPMIANIHKLTENGDHFTYGHNKEKEILDLFRDKSMLQLRQIIAYFEGDDAMEKRILKEDVDLLITASEIPIATLHIAKSLENGNKIPVLPFDHQHMAQLLDFSRKNPEFTAATQDLLEFLLAYYYLKQREDPKYAEMEEGKSLFYILYNEGHAMSESAPTTDSELDITRSTSVFLQMRDEFLERLRLEDKPEEIFRPRVVWGGIGRGDRLETEVVDRLDNEDGIELGRMVGIDLNDYSSEWPENLKDRVEFAKSNFVDAHKSIEGEFDVIMLPWSAFTDIIVRKNMDEVLYSLKRLLAPGGRIVIDIPIPIGEHSYRDANKLVESLMLGIPGLNNRDFEGAGGKLIPTVLNVAEIEDLIYNHFLRAGLAPVNLPKSQKERNALYNDVIEDDSCLGELRESGTDKDANEAPIYQAMNSVGGLANRITFVLEAKEQVDILKEYGVTGSILSLLLNS